MRGLFDISLRPLSRISRQERNQKMPVLTVSTRLPRLCPCGILVPTASDETAIRARVFMQAPHTFFLFRPMLRTGWMDTEQPSTVVHRLS